MAETNQTPVPHSGRRTLGVAVAVCLVCSLIVASAAVMLKPIQLANRIQARQQVLVELAGLTDRGLSVEQAYRQFDVRMVELASGEYHDDQDAEQFEITRAGKDAAQSISLAPEQDLAQIRRKPKYLPVYQVFDQAGKLETLVLPIYGYGLWSTLYGFIALEGDLRTVRGIQFYQHAETPGLGGEVDNSRWLDLWPGKVVFDDDWQPRIELVKGAVSTDTPDNQHKVDGLSGATMTTRGINNLLKFWFGQEGFRPFLLRLREERS
ncbi:Na(+)-translocating NADH-quinone reductase subunit C [Nitrosomonas sp. ANs5]|uniref:Na(+)-translocating NADH-quinone reductase subunit C n=1 Tax=Nitrosomonas sp. ANs5 TaxID=3423941 RepID=UPI003D337CFB